MAIWTVLAPFHQPELHLTCFRRVDQSIERDKGPTVKPLLSVVLSVVLPWLTGVARLRVRLWPCGLRDRSARWLRRPWCRVMARRLEAIAAVVYGGEEMGGG